MSATFIENIFNIYDLFQGKLFVLSKFDSVILLGMFSEFPKEK